MARTVSVDSAPLKFVQTVSVGPHVFHSDEPTDADGNDAGPNPHELLMASLGVCANMTVQMYAERHQWSLEGVHATVSYARVVAENPADSDAKIGMVDRIEIEISFAGNLSEGQQQRLLQIAGRCPVHRTLVSQVQIDTKLPVANSPLRVQKSAG
jgi:putative redox protein